MRIRSARTSVWEVMTYAELLRTAYALFASGDLAGYLSYCTPEIAFTIPGTNRVAGTFDRETFASTLIPRVMELSNGTFRETVLDVFTSDTGAIVLARHEFERNGRTYAYDTMHLYEIVQGRLASFREIPEDLRAFDAAWA